MRKRALILLTSFLLSTGIGTAGRIKVTMSGKAAIARSSPVLLVKHEPKYSQPNSPFASRMAAHSALGDRMRRSEGGLVASLRTSGFDPRTDPASGTNCDLHIVLWFVRGQVVLREPKALHGLFYYEPTKVWLDLTYFHPPSFEIGELRAKFQSLADPAARPKELAAEIAACTAGRFGRGK